MSASTYRKLAWATLASTIFVILWGAFVRATGSGAGCGSHWPTCNGEVVPRVPSVATAIELTHRATSGLLMLVTGVMVVAAFKAFPKGHAARRASVVAAAFLVIEALIGAGLVLLEYVADDKRLARGYWVGGHLVNTFLLTGAVTLAVWAGYGSAPLRFAGRHASRIVIGLVLLLAIGVTGSIAALGDTLFPATSLAQGVAHDLSPGAHALVRLRVIHPFLAAAGATYLLYVAGTLTTRGASERSRKIASWTATLVITQIVAGFVNLGLLAPTWMQLVHLLLADAVWIAVVSLGVATSIDANAGLETAEAAVSTANG
jgi:cytochrome c oxidase assembly protein subunit 15